MQGRARWARTHSGLTALLRPRTLVRYDAHKLAVFWSFLVEPDLAIAFRKQRVIASDANVKACVEASATLAHDDTARQYLLAAEDLDAQALGF